MMSTTSAEAATTHTDSAGDNQADVNGNTLLPLTPPAQIDKPPPIKIKVTDVSAPREQKSRVAESVTENVVPFPKKRHRGGRKPLDERLSLDYTKVSRNTWAFRIRPLDRSWPPVIIKRVNDKIFKEITRSMRRYAKFKAAHINQFKQRTLRADFGRATDADCAL